MGNAADRLGNSERPGVGSSSRNTLGTWSPLVAHERLAVGTVVVVWALLALPRMPRGICFGDWGDLQLAAAVLGICHPPGYPGYAALGWLAASAPGVDAAYMVSLSCLASGLVAAALGTLTQIRLGVNAWLAATIMVALTAYHRVWAGILAPEVYMPSLALLAGAAYLLLRHAHTGGAASLYVGALLFGIGAANRTPIVLCTPFFLLGWWLASRRNPTAAGWSVRRFFALCGVAALPGLFSLGYLLVRDSPATPYNYIEQYNLDTGILPEASAGWGARWQRTLWLITGSQFTDMLGTTWGGLRSKLRWLRQELLPDPFVTLCLFLGTVLFAAAVIRRRFPMVTWTLAGLILLAGATLGVLSSLDRIDEALSLWFGLTPVLRIAQAALFVMVATGAVLCVRREAVAGVVLLGMGASSIVYVCIYRIYGDAADLLPLMYAIGVFGGVVLSVLLPRVTSARRQAAAVVILAASAIITFLHAPYRYDTAAEADAMPFLRDADISSLPQDAVILTSWPHAPPLWYAKHVQTPRADLTVINASETEWQRLTADLLHRPIFATYPNEMWNPPDVWAVYRNLWRLQPKSETAP